MADSRSNRVLDDWRAVAHSATLPARAPRPSRSIYPIGVAGGAVAVTILLVALVLRGGPSALIGGPASGGPSATPAATTAPTPTIVPTANVTPAVTDEPLPNPGGTCSADQFVLGQTDSGSATGTYVSQGAYLLQPITNAGATCVLAVPRFIGVGSATGPIQAVSLNNIGDEVCANNACHYNTPASYTVRAGQSLTLEFSVSWGIEITDPNGHLYTPPPCPGAVANATRAEFPLASGSLLLQSSVTWDAVCSSPPSISLEFVLK